MPYSESLFKIPPYFVEMTSFFYKCNVSVIAYFYSGRIWPRPCSFFNEFDRVRSFTTARTFEWTPRHFRSPCTDRANPRFYSLNVGYSRGSNLDRLHGRLQAYRGS